jgi:hypothetical protein
VSGLTVGELEAVFPAGTELPESLERLCAFADVRDGAVACDFVLTPRAQRQVAAALGIADADAERFAMFGRDGTASLYGFWRVDERPLAQAPIVFVGAEGVGTGVIAATIEDFLALLAVGKEAVGWVEQWSEGECADVADYREWLRADRGLEAPADPRAVVEAARAAHPSLVEWAKERRGA